jgi:hypothetical protein
VDAPVARPDDESPRVAAPVTVSTDGIAWIRSGPEARVFLAIEREAEDSIDRINAAIAVIRARHGDPFSGEPAWRAHFAAMPWYTARQGPSPLTSGEKEAVSVLEQAIRSRP